MGTLGSDRYAPYAQRPHGRFVHHVEGHKPAFGIDVDFARHDALGDARAVTAVVRHLRADDKL